MHPSLAGRENFATHPVVLRCSPKLAAYVYKDTHLL